MKKTVRTLICLLLCAALALMIVGCGNKDTDEEAAKKEAEAILMLLCDGDYEAVIAKLDKSLDGLLTEEMLKEGWQLEAAPAGAFVSVAQVDASMNNGVMLVQLVSQHENGRLQLMCGFSKELRIKELIIKKLADKAEGILWPLPEGAAEEKVLLHQSTEKETGGAVVLPAGYDDNTPAVVLVHGSGATDMDETIGPNKPFRDIAYGLAEQGIASIRFDKVIYTHPELAKQEDFTVDIEYTDTVLEALRVLRATAELGDVYIAGHSQGGMLTPYLIARSEGGFAGGIVLAGSPRESWEIQYDQNLEVIAQLPEAQREENLQIIEAEKEKALRIAEMPDEELKSTTIFGLPAYYAKHFIAIDTLALAIENDAPMLILQGEEDFQVYYDKDFTAWQEGLSSMGDKITYRSYPGLSHLFMPAEGGITDPQNAYATPANVDQAVVDDMANWIKAQ